MENDVAGDASAGNIDLDGQALNSTILEYYKKFGRKRDLEQYFSLNTAQGDIKDVSSLFWRRMKSQDSSDSGDRSRESSLEVCRISIRCSELDDGARSSHESQDDNPKADSNSGSPPIIVEEVETPPADTSRHSDNESVKSDDNNSQKSMDVILDTSINKGFSPTSSITSQRKLEWDSLADVGYYNESEKKTSASSLSTLERLALKQQYSNNDSNQEHLMGPPTAHSTPLEENESKSKTKKGSKVTKISRKDVDFVEVNVPHTSDSKPTQSINVNLTKHISLNVDKGGISVDYVQKDISVSPEKRPLESIKPQETVDKEIQTSLLKKDKSSSSDVAINTRLYGQGIPVLINLNTYKKRLRRKKYVAVRRKPRSKKKIEADKENVPVLEKSGDQVSDAESFEYMPGHIYNQNQINKEPSVKISSVVGESSQPAGNKSSLESSGALTTDSSNRSRHSFTKDLEKSIKLLKETLNKRYNDSEIKKKLIKDVVQRLISSNYRDDETSTEFLSGISLSSRKLGLREDNTTTSTSDANNSAQKTRSPRPKKSILRSDKFNPNELSATSQSAPNLPIVSDSEKLVTNVKKASFSSNADTDTSSREKTSSDTAFAKTSSEELYQKYLDALRREQAYKKHLRDKQMFLRQKLVSSDTPFNIPATTRLDARSQIRIKELMNDLTRNNYDDGSGDASKLEGSLRSNLPVAPPIRNQRSHSVFTLSSSGGNSDRNRKTTPKKFETKDLPKAGHSKDDSHFCCCPYHSANKMGFSDSSVQVNLGQEPRRVNDEPEHSKCGRIVADEKTGEVKYLCFCQSNVAELKNPPENVLVYKCSRLTNRGVQSPGSSRHSPRSRGDFRKIILHDSDNDDHLFMSSQTNINKNSDNVRTKDTIRIHEAMRITQTDISINPRIADPSLTDIKIINNEDCAQLVFEHYRDVSKTTVNTEMQEQVDARVGGSTEMSDSASSTTHKATRIYQDEGEIAIHTEEDMQVQSEVDVVRETVYGEGQFGDDVTIPIKGTNMTLKVSLGPGLPAEGQPRNVNTIFTREGSPASSRRSGPGKQFGRSNSHVGVGDSTSSIRKDVVQDYKSDALQRNTIPKCPDRCSSRPCKCERTTPKEDLCFCPPKKDPCVCPPKKDAAVCPPTKDSCICAPRKFSGPEKKETRPYSPKRESRASSPRAQSRTSSPRAQSRTSSPRTQSRPCSPIREHRPLSPRKNTCICPPDRSKCNCRKDITKLCLCSNKECRGGCGRKVNRSTSPCPEHGDCGNICNEEPEYRKQVSRSTSPGPCPDNAPCGNVCDGNTETQQQAPCGCPDSTSCRGTCRENIAYRLLTTTRSTSPHAHSDVSVGSKRKESTKSHRIKKLKGMSSCLEEAQSSSKNICRESQTFPQKSERRVTKSSRSQTLPQSTYCYTNVPNKERFAPLPPNGDSEEGVTSQDEIGAPSAENANSKDLIMNVIQDITNRYSKKNIEKSQRKKCFKEIISILNYLLDTEETTDTDAIKGLRNLVVESCSSESADIPSNMPCPDACVEKVSSDEKKICPADCGCCNCKPQPDSDKVCPCDCKCTKCQSKTSCDKKVFVDKAVQLCSKKSKILKCYTESSELTSELPCTSSDSVTCKVLNRIRKECEKYHQKRCKCHSAKKCECSSTTSISCDQCKRVHYCMCKTHKCRYKPRNFCERLKKKCVAYNLIIQTSDSMISEETGCNTGYRPLKNIIVKVPSRKIPCTIDEVPCKPCSPRKAGRSHRSRSLPNDSLSSTDDFLKKSNACTVKDYLERNRPDFIEQTTKRQNCLKMISQASPQCPPCSPRSTRPCRPCSPRTRPCSPQNRPCSPQNRPCSPRNRPRRTCIPSHPCPPCNSPHVNTIIVSAPPECNPNPGCYTESGCNTQPGCFTESGCNTQPGCNTQTGSKTHSGCNTQTGCSAPIPGYCLGPPPLPFEPCDPLNLCAEKPLPNTVTTVEPPKLISEREMKQHSERIYKQLPEVVKKKEDARKENIRRTNLLMANLFNKSLQKKTLRGVVNLSNYSTVIKI